MILDDQTPIPLKLKLAALWTSVMFCYIYADYFGLYVPGSLQEMIDGQMGPLGPTTQGVLLGTSVMMVIPALMIFLSVALKAGVNRWLNIIFGAFYTLIICLTTLRSSWYFYVLYSVIEIALTLLVVWYAWTWPKREGART